MIEKFKEEFKNLKENDIVNFINAWAKDLYDERFLYDGDKWNKANYKIGFVNYNIHTNTTSGDYRFAWQINYKEGREFEYITLEPMKAFASNCSGDKLTLAWKKYLVKTCPHYLEAYLDNAQQNANKVIATAQTEIEEMKK